jgi:hypothetical protein
MIIFTLFTIILMAGPIFAGQLQRDDFSGVTPYTFDGDESAVAPHDFGGFTLDNFFDMYSFIIPFDAPVELPAPGGENLILTFDIPQVAVGMDVTSNSDVYFYGADDVLLAMIPASNIAAWPERNGFAGYSDDNGEMIFWVQIGTFDAFLDNVYLGEGTVATQNSSWNEIKRMYR